MQREKKILITGSEGKIGREISGYFEETHEVIRIDKKLGHDLTDINVVRDIFSESHDFYAVIILHAYNPVPVKNAKKVEPIDVSLDELRDYFEVNVFSVFELCKQYLRANQRGRIINVGSLYALRAPKHYIYKDFVKPIGYSLTKSSILLMTKYLASYYAPNFLINTVVLGGLSDEDQENSFRIRYSEHTPAGRLMKRSELISVFEFLLDERNTYTNGTEVIVDGGWSAW